MFMTYFWGTGSATAVTSFKGSVTYKRVTDLVHAPVSHPLLFYRSPEKVSDLLPVAQESRRAKGSAQGSGQDFINGNPGRWVIPLLLDGAALAQRSHGP